MKLNLTVTELFREFQPEGVLFESTGEGTTVLSRIAAVEDCKPGDLVFVDKAEYVPLIESRRPAAVVTSPKLKTTLTEVGGLEVLTSNNVSLAHALIKQKYADRDFASAGWSESLHPSAVIHPSVQIGQGSVIEPHVVIGQGAKIGANCRIMAGAVIENGAQIGDYCLIHPRAIIGYDCQLGNEVVVGSGTVIGSEGYGFAQSRDRKSYAIPQTGTVVVEDRVRFGANCCVDRATYQRTRIGAGTKIDNLCHIAHNVDIGEDCLLTSMLCVAGSTKIGNRVMTSGQTGILDHIKVCDDAVLVHRAGVTKDIDQPGAYAGLPAQPLSEYMKNVAATRSAAEQRKRLSALEKQIESLAEQVRRS